MTGKPSCPVRREAARNRTRSQRAPHRAADPTAWMMRTRRLARDFERRSTSAEAMVYWSMTLLMTRRLARPHPQQA